MCPRRRKKTGGGKRNQRKRGLKEPKPPFLRLGEGGEKPPFCLRSPKKGFLGRGRKKIEGGQRVSLLPKGENINRGGREIDGRRRHATNKEFQTHCSLLSILCPFRDGGRRSTKKREFRRRSTSIFFPMRRHFISIFLMAHSLLPSSRIN